MSAVRKLPVGFEQLEPFLAYWAADTLAARDTRRLESTEMQRLEFYNAAKDVVPAALDHLDAKPFAEYEDADHRLLDLMLGLIHVALAVEVEKGEEHLHARGAWQMPIIRERADARTLAARARSSTCS